jgi:hypothetical protein
MRFVRSTAVLVALIGTTVAFGIPGSPAASADPLDARIAKARKAVWHWQRVMQRPLASPARVGRALAQSSSEYKRRALRSWLRRASRVRRKAQDPPHERQFRCIHRHEGSWKANTGNGYYGGLQMNLAFQRDYGRWLLRTKGRAHRWTPIEQIWVGERALREGRGFHPWPVAARRCGLI